MKRKICVITGTRADYGILYPVMKKIRASGKLELYVVATGMHLMKEFGYTVREIEKDGFKIYAKVDISYKEDIGQAMAFSVGKAVSMFSKVFGKLKPAMVMVMGDRGEMLAAAIAANYMNIPVAHIHGGEISGHVDGVVRHAITKLAHIHFPATQKAKKRILNLGEEPGRVFVAGAPALDSILNGKFELTKKYPIAVNKPFVLLVQHPVLAQSDKAGEQMRITLEAIKTLKVKTLVIYPNADAGGRQMIKVIQKYARLPFIKTFKSLPHKDYLALMKRSAVLVGNSSSGLIEAPSLKVPAVNIGIRQQDRERGENVIDVAHNKNAIIKAIKKALYDKKFKEKVKRGKNPYGDGHAGERIIRVLKAIKLDERLLEKQITF